MTKKNLGGLKMQTIEMLLVSTLQADTTQPRKTFDEEPLQFLMDSVKDYGVLIPLFVRRIATRGGDPVYVILDGERRFRVACALGVTELPCLILDNLNDIQVLEKQLLLDCLKEKLASVERDAAIHQYWKMLKSLPPEELDQMKPDKTKADDWMIYYISDHVGVSVYVVKMAVNKFDFIERNISFHQKILEMIEGNAEQKELMQKRYNSVLEETARNPDFRDNEDARKNVIENFVKSTGDGGMDSQSLRSNMKEMSENGDLSDDTIKRKTKVPTDAKTLVANYVEKLAKITSELISNMKSNNIKKVTKTYERLLIESLIETISHLTGKAYELNEVKENK